MHKRSATLKTNFKLNDKLIIMAKYQVTIAQTWSEEVIVTAKTEAEAKKKAWEKWKAKKNNYTLEAEREP